MKSNHILFDILSDYLDQKLSTEVNQKVKDHLIKCESCQNELNKLKRMLNLVSSLKTEKTVNYERFVSDIFKKQQVIKSKFNIYKILWPISAAAVVMFFILSGIIDTGFINPNTTQVAKDSITNDNLKNVFREYTIENKTIDEIINHVKVNNAKVLQVTNDSIVAEAKFSDYQKIRYGTAVSDESHLFLNDNSLVTVGTERKNINQITNTKAIERFVKFRIKIK